MLRFRIAAVLCALAIASPSFAQETLFAATQRPGPGSLVTVDPATGVTTVVGGFGAASINANNISGMAYNAGSDILLAGGGFDDAAVPIRSGALYRVDRGTGALTLIGLDAAVPFTFDGFADMALQSGTNICYVSDGFGTQNLSWVNQSTGNVYQLGVLALPGTNRGNGLEFDNLGNLFWFDQLNCYTIDPVAGPPAILATRALTYTGFPAAVGTRRINSVSLRPSTGQLFCLVFDGNTTGPQAGVTYLATIEAHPLLPTVTVTFVGNTLIAGVPTPLDALCWVGPAVLSAAGGGGAAGSQDKDRKHATLKGCFVDETSCPPAAWSALIALLAVALAGIVFRRCMA